MKHHATLPIATALCLLAGIPVLSYAQDAPLFPATPAAGTGTTRSNQQTTPAVPTKSSTAPLTPAEETAESVITLLKLDTVTIAKLDRAYESYARTRLEQEAQIANWQNELKTAQAATTFNQSKASQLSGNISGSEHKIADAYLKARGEALNALSSLQRIRLERVEAEDRTVWDDKYRFLLLSQVEDLWRTPIDPETGQAILNASRSAADAARSAQLNYYPTYYAASPFYNYGWNSYDSYFAWSRNNYGYGYGYGSVYGYQAPFYAHSGSRWNNDRYRDNYQNYPRDTNARPLWRRSDTGQRPPETQGINPEARRPLYRPSNSGRNGAIDVSRPTSTPPDGTPSWERQPQRESPRREPSRPNRDNGNGNGNGNDRNNDRGRPEPPKRPDPPRPEPPKQEQPRPEPPRPDPPKSDPPRSEPKQPERNNDGGGHWNRGGGGRGR